MKNVIFAKIPISNVRTEADGNTYADAQLTPEQVDFVNRKNQISPTTIDFYQMLGDQFIAPEIMPYIVANPEQFKDDKCVGHIARNMMSDNGLDDDSRKDLNDMLDSSSYD